MALNVHRGREIKTTGDGFLALFDSPTRAALCAAEMLRSSSAIGLEIRVGVHTGEVEVTDNDVRGIAVHTAARILALAGPGTVLFSTSAAGLVDGPGLSFEDAGSHGSRVSPGPARSRASSSACRRTDREFAAARSSRAYASIGPRRRLRRRPPVSSSGDTTGSGAGGTSGSSDWSASPERMIRWSSASTAGSVSSWR